MKPDTQQDGAAFMNELASREAGLSKWLIVVAAMLLMLTSQLPAANTALWEEGISLIPYPQQVTLAEGNFELGRRLTLVLRGQDSSADRFAAEDLAARLASGWGIRARIGESSRGGSVVLQRVKGGGLGEQGYQLAVSHRLGSYNRGKRSRVVLRHQDAAATDTAYGKRPQYQMHADHRQARYPGARGPLRYQAPSGPLRIRPVVSFRDLADYKINMLLWEWEDKFAYPSHPEIGAPGAFTSR